MRKALAAVAAAVMLLASGAAAPVGAEVDELWDYRAATVGGRYLPLVGDFDGDSTSDVLWYAAGSPADHLWLGRQGERAAFTSVPAPVGGTYRPIVGNFAGDSRDDILWYAPGATLDPVWVADDSPDFFHKSGRVSVVGTSHTPFVLHDERSDTTHDAIVWHSSAPTAAVWHFVDGTTGTSIGFARSNEPVVAGSRPVVGDWNSDRIDDVIFYGRGTIPDQRWTARSTGGFTRSTIDAGGSYDPIVVQGSGTPDAPPIVDSILWWGDGSGPDSYWQNDGSAFTRLPANLAGLSGAVVPFIAAANLVYRPSGSEQLVIDDGPSLGTLGLSPSGRDIGPGYLPLVGDFDGDGLPDIFWYGPGSLADQVWHLAAGGGGPNPS